jgi:hypothetical protein
MIVVGTTTSSSFFYHFNLFYIYLQSTNIFRQNTTGGLVQPPFGVIGDLVELAFFITFTLSRKYSVSKVPNHAKRQHVRL